MRRSNFLPLVVLTLAFAGVITFGGCSVFRNPDGSVNVEKTQQATAAAAETATKAGSFFGPIGQAIGGAVALIITAVGAKAIGQLRGEKIGYDQGALDASGKPLPSSTINPIT